MAIKPKRPQLGKIKQWSSGLSSKLSGGASNIDPNLKQDLFGELETRGSGNANLYAATESYWSYLSKKKPLTFDASAVQLADTASVASGALSTKPDTKVLPVEAMGLAMTSYGAAFADSSAYGHALTSFGAAHVKLGSLQAAFAKDTSNIFLSRIARSKTAIEAFHAAIKKLDAATAKMEAAQAKVQKSRKEKRDLEEELRLAKAAYDEAVSDVEARAEAIQDSETDDLDCLVTYLQQHVDYLGQAQAVLEQARSALGEGRGTPRRPLPPSLPRSRSASGAKPQQPPALPRRTSAREPIELTRSSSRMTTRSTISQTNSEGKGARDSPVGNDDGESTARRNDREKKGRLRMPSFSAAGDTVTSMASGLGTFSRSKTTSLFGSNSNGDSHSPDKEKGESSRWSLMGRGRKESGFQDLDATRDDLRNLRVDRAQAVHNKVSSEDVDLGPMNAEPEALHEDATRSAPLTSSQRGSSKRNSLRDESPFSPTLHESFATVHERGESSLGMDMPMDSNYLGVMGTQPVDLHHTGLSAYSDGGDPFSGGVNGFLSPQETGQSIGRLHTEDEAEHDDEAALTGGKAGTRRNSVTNGNGWTKSLPFANGLREREAKGAYSNGFNERDWEAEEGRSSFAGSHSSGGGSTRGPPPPVPSSSAFLKQARSRQTPPPPPPPPLPSRGYSSGQA